MTDNITFGMRLRCERDRLALQQSELAAAGGVRRVDQHLYETDIRVPEMEYLKNVAASGVDVIYLILGKRTAWGDTNRIEMSTVHADELYRLVDEYAIDKKGRPLPLIIRAWFHQLLMTSCGDAGSEITPGLWQDGMSKLNAAHLAQTLRVAEA